MSHGRETWALTYLSKYGEGEGNSLANRGFSSLDELKIPRPDTNRIVKPFCARPDLRFEFNREHAHIIRRDNFPPGVYGIACPIPIAP